MTDFAPAAYMDALFKRLEPRRVDLEETPFRGMNRQQQDQETRLIAKTDPDAAWEAFEQWVSHEAFIEAWRNRDAFEMLRLMDSAVREGLEDDINHFYSEEL